MSLLLSAQNLSKSFGEKLLFQDLSFVVNENERVGLIGPNGSGKSTLLKILAQQASSDSGDLIPRRGLRMAFLSQNPYFSESLTVRSVLARNFTDLESWECDQKIEEFYWKFALSESDLQLESPVEMLSGGWKKRLAILELMIQDPDLVLMDEPTNHLDIEGIFWLENLVAKSSFATLIVTHDRRFLDNISTVIFELDRRHENGLLRVEGNYSRFVEVKSSLMAAQESRETSLRNVLRRETEWVKAGVKARTTKQQARLQRYGELESEVHELAIRNQKTELNIEFQKAQDKPKRLLEAKNITKSYEKEKPLFYRLNLLLTPGHCLGLIGENGCGKSSLIRVLLKEERPDEGSIFHSDLLKIAYFEQGKEQLDPKKTLIQSVCPYGDQVFYQKRHIHVRSYLEKFLFPQDKMDMPAGSLSGGEQSRLLLAKLMLVEANLLILDEPTNDLDIPTMNVLEQCLHEFEGAALLVTHDRAFLERVSDRFLGFPPQKARSSYSQIQYFDTLNQWQTWFLHQLQDSPLPKNKLEKVSHPKKISGSRLKEQQKLIKKIEKLESEYQILERDCSDPQIADDFEKLSEKGSQMKELQEKIDDLYSKWSALEEPLD